MTRECVLAGSAEAVNAALASPMLPALGFEITGAILVGAGDVPVAVVARTPAWDAIRLPDSGGGRALVLAEAPPTGAAARLILAQAADARKHVFVLGSDGLRPMRLEDLIGRSSDLDPVRARALVTGKRVMITGGGGSIGGALARRIDALDPARLTLLDNSEFNLFQAARALPKASLALADIRDASAIRRWFDREQPDIVFHAAALKHVPLVEAFPCEGVATNVFGLRHVAEASREAGAAMIFLSTDKAAEPSGAMGATKRLGEIYCQALDRAGGARVVPVRLGNVLGSSGSVAPLFESQLAAGGPLTVTHPDVTRFFVTMEQAADTLIQAALSIFAAEDAHRGMVLTVDMGEALSVAELAREVIRLEALRPDIDVAITFTGLRPGEKLHEVLLGADEWRAPDPAPGVMAAASPARGLAELHAVLERLAMLARQGADDAVRLELFSALEQAGAAAAAASNRTA